VGQLGGRRAAGGIPAGILQHSGQPGPGLPTALAALQVVEVVVGQVRGRAARVSPRPGNQKLR
jgi:hypothetical protein